jgi:hypothetical protein
MQLLVNYSLCSVINHRYALWFNAANYVDVVSYAASYVVKQEEVPYLDDKVRIEDSMVAIEVRKRPYGVC